MSFMIKKIISFVSLKFPYVGDRENTFLVSWNGSKVFLLIIRQPFYSVRQMPWKYQSTNGEGKSFLRRLWFSQNLILFTLVMFLIFLYIISVLVFYLKCFLFSD